MVDDTKMPDIAYRIVSPWRIAHSNIPRKWDIENERTKKNESKVQQNVKFRLSGCNSVIQQSNLLRTSMNLGCNSFDKCSIECHKRNSFTVLKGLIFWPFICLRHPNRMKSGRPTVRKWLKAKRSPSHFDFTKNKLCIPLTPRRAAPRHITPHHVIQWVHIVHGMKKQ